MRLTLRNNAHYPAAAMNIQTLIADAESRAQAGGLSIDDLCKAAGIARSTWQRWKSGATEPTMRTWRRVEDALPPQPEPEPEPESAEGEAA